MVVPPTPIMIFVFRWYLLWWRSGSLFRENAYWCLGFIVYCVSN